MFANRFTAVLDTCVIVSVLKRNMLLSLAQAELYRPRWSDQILDEFERTVTKLLIEAGCEVSEAPAMAASSRLKMVTAFQDATIYDYASIEEGFKNLPDPDDAHVVAAAVKTKASIIVTDNLKDFPSSVLDNLEIEAKSADDFISDTLDLNTPVALAALKSMRLRLKNPALTTDELLLRMEQNNLLQVADILRDNRELW